MQPSEENYLGYNVYLPMKKQYISALVFDTFEPLNEDDKWNGLKGEYTSAPGHQNWKRFKEHNGKQILIDSTNKQHVLTQRSNRQV